jgi:tetratricopeptide (TPR) repeat protein
MMITSHVCGLVFSLLLVCLSLGLGQSPSAQSELNSISSALRNRDYAGALALSKGALAKRPEDYKIWTLRGIATAGTGNPSLALKSYQHALTIAPSYLPALEGAAQTEFQLGQDAAKPLLLKILAQRPDDPTSHAMLGVLDYRNNNCADAVAHFQKGASVIAAQPVALNEYGLCLVNLKQGEAAVTVFTEALALDPARRHARYNLALAQWGVHRSEDALATLRPLVEDSADEGASTLAAEISEANGDTAHAVEVLRKAILSSPKDADAYLQFAALSYDHASPKVGIDILNAGLTQLPKEPRLYLVRGILLTQLGEFTHAADDFETASRIDPQLGFLGVAEGLVQSQQHNSGEALIQFRDAVKAHPSEALAHYLLAEALQEQGKPEGSAEYREEVAAATRALQLDSHLVAAHDLLAAVYIENGHTDQAIEHSHAALSLDPNDQQAVYHLVVALRKTDQKDQIPALLKRLIELRTTAQAGQQANKRYRLYESPVATPASSPAGP